MRRLNVANRKQAIKVVTELDAFPKVLDDCQEKTASGGGISAKMKRKETRTGRATRKDNTPEGQDEPTRKSYGLRKRKRETEPNEQDESLLNENTKRRCLNDDQQPRRTQHEIPPKEQKMQHTKINTKKHPQPHIQDEETLPKQPIGKNVKQEIQGKKAKHLTQLSMKKDKNCKRKTSDSNPPVLKCTPLKGEQLSRMKVTKRDKDGRKRTLHGTTKPVKKEILQITPKPMSKVPEKEICNPKQKARKQSRVRVLKNSDQTKEAQPHSDIQQSTDGKQCRISKPKMMKRESTKTACKLETKADNPLFLTRKISAKDFSTLFLKKFYARIYPEASTMSNIHGISVSNDNFIWVNHVGKCVQLLNSSGEVLRTIQLDFDPVCNCCTPSGDLLVTQGYSGVSKPVITMISRDGNIRVLADLSSYATNLLGIICENETIFVVGYSNKPGFHGARKRYFIVKLSISGEVERVYNTEKKCDDINHVISLNGQMIALRTMKTAMIPVKDGTISSKKLNGVCITNTYSASASVDNLGNVILASNSELMIIDPTLKFMHKIPTDIGHIASTAVDKTNQLWLGTYSGGLYSAQYLI